MKPFKILDLVQGSPEWLAYRDENVTATDVAVLMGLMTKYKRTPYTLYHDKLYHIRLEDNPYMARGRELEPYGIAKANEVLSTNFEKLTVQSFACPWLMASLDGFDIEKNMLLEVKTTGVDGMLQASLGILKEEWEVQGQTQMFVTGLDSMWFMIYQDDETYYLIELKADKDFHKKIIFESLNFFEMLTNKITPPLDKKDDLIIRDEEANEIALQLKHAKLKAKGIDAQVKTLTQELLEFTDGGNTYFPDAGLKLSYIEGRKTVDYKGICNSLGVEQSVYDENTKQGKEFFKITIDGLKND